MLSSLLWHFPQFYYRASFAHDDETVNDDDQTERDHG